MGGIRRRHAIDAVEGAYRPLSAPVAGADHRGIRQSGERRLPWLSRRSYPLRDAGLGDAGMRYGAPCKCSADPWGVV
jgi:hypothetical protein